MVRNRSIVHSGFGNTGCCYAILEALTSEGLTLYANGDACWGDVYSLDRWDHRVLGDGWFPHRLGPVDGDEVDIGMVCGGYIVGSYGTIWSPERTIVVTVDRDLRAAVLKLYRDIGLIAAYSGTFYLDGDVNNLNPRNIVGYEGATLQRSLGVEDYTRWADMLVRGYSFEDVAREECLTGIDIRARVSGILKERYGVSRITAGFFERFYWDFEKKVIAHGRYYGVDDERVSKVAKLPTGAIMEENIFINACRIAYRRFVVNHK